MRKRLIGVGLVLGVAGATAVLAGGPAAIRLAAADGVEVRGDLYALENDEAKSAPMVLLFHQAGSNRAEYAEIAPRLNDLGFHALAIDQRSGGERWGHRNETVDGLGKSTDYLAALPDLEAALQWKADSGYRGKTLVWGSSYSAALVFLLAADHGAIDGVLAFSPGEYLGTKSDEVRKAAARVHQPVIVFTPDKERDRAKPVVDAVATQDKRFVVPDRAVHGSSMLVRERNPGADDIWIEVQAFLQRFKD